MCTKFEVSILSSLFSIIYQLHKTFLTRHFFLLKCLCQVMKVGMVMYLCVRRIDFDSFYDFDIWNYSESVCLWGWGGGHFITPISSRQRFSYYCFFFFFLHLRLKMCKMDPSTQNKKYNFKKKKSLCIYFCYVVNFLVIKDMDVNIHDRLFNITLRYKFK